MHRSANHTITLQYLRVERKQRLHTQNTIHAQAAQYSLPYRKVLFRETECAHLLLSPPQHTNFCIFLIQNTVKYELLCLRNIILKGRGQGSNQEKKKQDGGRGGEEARVGIKIFAVNS